MTESVRKEKIQMSSLILIAMETLEESDLQLKGQSRDYRKRDYGKTG